ncbi:helix-turn-helix transcriptional regulator [Azospirillum sp. Sh1]|uniref:helix-turn-helix domain-containing protein n=1 Tax=Azospirillum sp. Sh1 TaxID=2607285 RepID=UPI0011F00789|nr:helix-turn-helix transcriptional regulator [Azospirillum sp. Sh1]KAA0573410.1 helix-turn-helix transcriptional regulator [Azospirillum sp. Sh1]
MASYLDLVLPGEIVAQRRKELHMTQTEVAKKMGYRNPNFVSMMESNSSRVPIERCFELADILEMDRIWFLKRVLGDHYPQVSEELFSAASLRRLLDEAEQKEAA